MGSKTGPVSGVNEAWKTKTRGSVDTSGVNNFSAVLPKVGEFPAHRAEPPRPNAEPPLPSSLVTRFRSEVTR